MEDSNLITKIKSLDNIKPNQEWVALTKKNILGQGLSYRPSFASVIGHMMFQYKLAIAGLILICVTGGTWIATENALPGQSLYSVKLIGEKGLAMLGGKNQEAQEPLTNLQLAVKQLAALNLVSERKLTQDVPAAVQEFAATKAAARKQVLELAQKDPANAAEIVKSVGSQIQQIDATERTVFADLGISASASGSANHDSDSSDKAIVELLLTGSQKAALTSTQQQDLAYARGLYNAGNYEGALEFYLNSSLSQ
jgi:hypothetical protein